MLYCQAMTPEAGVLKIIPDLQMPPAEASQYFRDRKNMLLGAFTADERAMFSTSWMHVGKIVLGMNGLMSLIAVGNHGNEELVSVPMKRALADDAVLLAPETRGRIVEITERGTRTGALRPQELAVDLRAIFQVGQAMVNGSLGSSASEQELLRHKTCEAEAIDLLTTTELLARILFERDLAAARSIITEALQAEGTRDFTGWYGLQRQSFVDRGLLATAATNF